MALNKSLATAYYLKEDLRQFWEQPGKKFATLFLDGWIKRAEASGIKMLQQMAKTLAAHRSGLLAYYDVMITTGPMEGTNNKIKTMKRQAYGFRDQEFFKLKILAIHETQVRTSRISRSSQLVRRRALPPDEPQISFPTLFGALEQGKTSRNGTREEKVIWSFFVHIRTKKVRAFCSQLCAKMTNVFVVTMSMPQSLLIKPLA